MASTRAISLFAAVAALSAALLSWPALADDRALDLDFAKRVFVGAVPKPRAYACFVRHYDAEHLA
jgi:hypothetical protein